MLDTLFVLRKRQIRADKHLSAAREHLQQKEALIKVKEDEKSSAKAGIENEHARHEREFRSLRQTLDEQRILIAS